MNEGLKAHWHKKGHLVPWNITKGWSLVIVEESWQSVIILSERIKRIRVRAEFSGPKRTKGSFRSMVSIDRSTQPHSFIGRTGYHTSLGFPGRCQLRFHTIDQVNRVWYTVFDWKWTCPRWFYQSSRSKCYTTCVYVYFVMYCDYPARVTHVI